MFINIEYNQFDIIQIETNLPQIYDNFNLFWPNDPVKILKVNRVTNDRAQIEFEAQTCGLASI